MFDFLPYNVFRASMKLSQQCSPLCTSLWNDNLLISYFTFKFFFSHLPPPFLSKCLRDKIYCHLPQISFRGYRWFWSGWATGWRRDAKHKASIDLSILHSIQHRSLFHTTAPQREARQTKRLQTVTMPVTSSHKWSLQPLGPLHIYSTQKTRKTTITVLHLSLSA